MSPRFPTSENPVPGSEGCAPRLSCKQSTRSQNSRAISRLTQRANGWVKRSHGLAIAITALSIIAMAATTTACGGSEQAVDIEKLKTAPTLAAPLGPGKSIVSKTVDGRFGIGFTFDTASGQRLIMQWEGPADGSSGTTNYSREDAEKIATNQLGDSAVPAEALSLEPAPEWSTAWTGSVEGIPAFAQAWERGQCSAIILTTLPRSEAAGPLTTIDAQLKEACGD